MHELILAAIDAGVDWSIENPQNSFWWKTLQVLDICCRVTSYAVTFDQCMYMLRPPDYVKGGPDVRTRKSTTLLTSVSSLRDLEVRCDHKHSHITALGSCSTNCKTVKRAQAAGVYPTRLCRKWSQLISGHGCSGCVTRCKAGERKA